MRLHFFNIKLVQQLTPLAIILSKVQSIVSLSQQVIIKLYTLQNNRNSHMTIIS